jgi:hypothetical protein
MRRIVEAILFLLRGGLPWRRGEMDASVIADKHGNTELVLEIADSSTDRGFLDAKAFGRTSEASAFRRCNKIAKVAQFDHRIVAPASRAHSRALAHGPELSR